MTNKPTAIIVDIDEAINDYEQWNGYSPDAARWTPDSTHTLTAEKLDMLRQAFTQANQLITEVGHAAKTAMEHTGQALQQFAKDMEAQRPTLEAAGLLDEQPPADPFKAAIWHKKRRDTGPKPQLNAYKTKEKARR